MEKYIALLVKDFCTTLGIQELKREKVPEYHETYNFGKDAKIDGILEPHARHFVGRLMYLVRGCRLDCTREVTMPWARLEQPSFTGTPDNQHHGEAGIQEAGLKHLAFDSV